MTVPEALLIRAFPGGKHTIQSDSSEGDQYHYREHHHHRQMFGPAAGEWYARTIGNVISACSNDERRLRTLRNSP